MAYEIRQIGPAGQRLLSDVALTPSDFAEIATTIQTTPMRARKIGFAAAHRATVRTPIETHWNGIETNDVAEVGDWIVTNLTPARNVLKDDAGQTNIYVIRDRRFFELYARGEGEIDQQPIFRSISEVSAIFLSAGFEIVAPWGKLQNADTGYLILSGAEVYGNAKQPFETTYEAL